MRKNAIKASFPTKLPLMKTSGEPFRPDFILVIQDGKVRIAGIDPHVNLTPLIYSLRDTLDLVEDIQWAKNKKKK
ncbi:MAG: hypothetical protein ABFD07_07265 [Methanobacterium sp.]